MSSKWLLFCRDLRARLCLGVTNTESTIEARNVHLACVGTFNSGSDFSTKPYADFLDHFERRAGVEV